ncbi:distal tail protein Dit [Cohnella terricola]|uniref:Phage tail protein n=1 Tax=Cohnella terricola TaxID=1289167 RepID=A0A559JDM9_9BACL|nr:distal tail protein Dit [Cohnella terricola]TVX97969.1 phage tail protein [Cohnella terricola]
MTIKDSIYFIYDGIESKRYGIANVNLDSGMQEEYFAASRRINEEQIRGRSKPYFQGIEKEPLKFSVSFAFEEAWDEATIREVKRWLTEPDYYKPLIFSNDPEKVYYAICVDDPQLVHNCLQQGYMKLNFRCNDAYAYSPLSLSKVYDWDENPLIIARNAFTNGDKHGILLNSNDQITLNTAKTWNDISPAISWKDLSI